jgi:hypothetical protein
MGGGLMQLVAYGAQDIYLTGNPQITFFKVVYRRHTNFSMEAIEQTMNGTTSTTAAGQTATCTISRNGDLIHKVYVTTDSNPTSTESAWEGSALVNEVELEIGGQRIDRHYYEWNQVWEELSTDESKAVALKAMKGDIGNRILSAHTSASTGVKHVQIPLNFWFCRNVGLALPLIALQYHEVKLKFTWGQPAAGTYACNVLVDYIYLDTDERRRFAQVSHEYLIEQIQKFDASKGSGDSVSANLNFNHPVKELVWTNDKGIENDDGTSNVQLKLNGHDRFSERKLEYFQLRQPFDFHTAVPRQNLPTAAQLTSNMLVKGDQIGTAITGIIANATTSDAVAAGSIMVVKTDSAPGTDDDTDAAFDAGVAAVGAVGYIVDKTNLGDNLQVGRLYEIVVNGSDSASASTTVSKTIITTLTLKSTGVTSGANQDYNTGSSFLRFDKLLVAASPTTNLNAAAAAVQTVFNISSLKEFTPDSNIFTQARTSKMTRKVNVYSFGLKPEEHQPSGTCNFSRIDSAKLEFKSLSSTLDTISIYAVNYNVLRIMSGMGGLAYSN